MTFDSTFLIFLAEWLGVIAVTMILATSPRFTRRPISFAYPRRDGLFALAVFLIAWIIAFAYFNSVPQHIAYVAESGVDLTGWLQRLAAAVLGLVGLLSLLFVRRQPPLSAGWSKANFRPAIQMGLGLIIITLLLRGRFMDLFNGFTSTQIIGLAVFAGLALAEETLFRGYIQLRLTSWLGEHWGWLATGALYVLWQLPGRIFMLGWTELWPLLLFSLIQGLLCGYIMQKSGHILAPAMYRWISNWLMLF